MIHQYKLNGYNIVLDVFSGSVHITDEAAYDAIQYLDQGKTKEETGRLLEEKYRAKGLTEEDAADIFADIEELRDAGKLFTEDVYKDHSSYPANPKLASIFFAAGETETWGVGFDKIRRECEKAGAPLPVIEIGDESTPDKGVTVHCNSK